MTFSDDARTRNSGMSSDKKGKKKEMRFNCALWLVPAEFSSEAATRV
jgi:hypothetical protein